MFQIVCPLGHTLEISKEHIGQRLMCPMCQAVVHTSPPRPGEQPGAKYEVQCAQGHILRVKQKYLNKEIRCPSCQQLVSMKPGMMLTSNGVTLSTAMPEAFKKSKKTKRDTPKPPASSKNLAPQPPSLRTVRTKRIPPPPSTGQKGDTDDQPPIPAELVDDSTFEVDEQRVAPKATTITPATISDDEDFEFEVVDTQFNMELKASGIDPISAPSTRKKDSQKIPPPPPVQMLPANPGVPTGLHSLSGSEMIKVSHAAREVSEPPAMTQFNCPHGHLLEVESKYQGAQIQCPTCKAIFTMP